MTRLLAWLVAVAMLTGCKGSGVTTSLDPFSRTTVEPPRTGRITGQPVADPYYSPTRQAVLPRSTTQQGPTTQGSTGPGDRIRIPLAARTAQELSGSPASHNGSEGWSGPTGHAPSARSTAAAATSSAVATAGSSARPADRASPQPSSNAPSGTPAPQQRIVGTIQPRPSGSAGSSRGVPPPGGASSVEGQGRRAVVPADTVDIMDLPPVGSTSTSQSRGNPSGIQLVSGTEVLEDPSARTPLNSRSYPAIPGGIAADSFSARHRYAYDPDYRWLRGRLEYSQIDRRWKLRYIPIDGTSDEFGGSVALSNPSLLSGYERGEFVEVHGALGKPAQDGDRGYAPEFEIGEIKRLGN